jgi:glutaconate CoA-transferase subunit A
MIETIAQCGAETVGRQGVGRWQHRDVPADRGSEQRPRQEDQVTDKVCSLDEAVSLVRDGDVVGLQGGPTQCTPMALVRQLMRVERRDLHVVCLIAGVSVDWLAAAGVISGATFAAVTMEQFGLCQRFRRGAEAGRIATDELSETALLARLGAAARGLPFLPTRGLIGTDLVARSGGTLRVMDDPFGGPPVLACRALTPDVALFHAHRADRRGNVGLHPEVGYPVLTALARAARRVVVTVEEIVPTDELRRAPDRTILPGFAVDAVVEVRHGAHPTSLFPDYGYDAAMFREWTEAATDDGSTAAFLDTYVYGPDGHGAYLDLLGADRLAGLADWSER